MKKKIGKIVLIVVSILFVLFLGLVVYFVFDLNHNKEIFTDIDGYENDRTDRFSESMKKIWPESISQDMDAEHYKLMTYYDDITAYTGYLEVKYSNDSFEAEKNRLSDMNVSDDFQVNSLYSCDSYEVIYLSVNQDDMFQKCSYVLTDGKDKIIYVHLENPHKIRDDYDQVIPGEYLLEYLKKQ